ALDWGPPKRLAQRLEISAERTSTSTIRRVPRPRSPWSAPADDEAEPVPVPAHAGGGSHDATS
ncbi:MAG TPA: hypothetical protein VKQ71_12885, partial [Acidimicrobiales bacterium]|nr:hypothetical protein [Acidimicrobiales bacterium]